MADDAAGTETGRMIAFLRKIGIPMEPATLPVDGFLPGWQVREGRLVVDLARLRYPGDLLHEGGHIPLVDPALRPLLSTDLSLPGVDMARLESAVVPWSYAAALHLEIDPAVVFHDGGYGGHSRGLLTTFALGVYPGVPLSEELGADGVAGESGRARRRAVPAHAAPDTRRPVTAVTGRHTGRARLGAVANA